MIPPIRMMKFQWRRNVILLQFIQIYDKSDWYPGIPPYIPMNIPCRSHYIQLNLHDNP